MSLAQIVNYNLSLLIHTNPIVDHIRCNFSHLPPCKLETAHSQERTLEAKKPALERAERARCMEEKRCRERERQKIHAEVLQKQMAELKEREEEVR